MKKTTDLIKDHYIHEILSKGKRPESVYLFMQELALDEKQFYEHFSSFYEVEKTIWADFFTDTVSKITEEEVYEQYSVREKILALNYTMIETLKARRSFVVYTIRHLSNLSFGGDVWEKLQKEFETYIQQLITEGTYTNEINERPFLTERYKKVLWWQFAYVLRFWAKDMSSGFERTDAVIEKSVNFSLDLLGRNIVDSAFDFAKFLWSNK